MDVEEASDITDALAHGYHLVGDQGDGGVEPIGQGDQELRDLLGSVGDGGERRERGESQNRQGN